MKAARSRVTRGKIGLLGRGVTDDFVAAQRRRVSAEGANSIPSVRPPAGVSRGDERLRKCFHPEADREWIDPETHRREVFR